LQLSLYLQYFYSTIERFQETTRALGSFWSILSSGYARRNGLTWTNKCVRGIPDINVLAGRIRQRGRCDQEFTRLLFTKTDTASSNAKPLAAIPILECVEKDHQIEIGIVERKEIEKALDVLMTHNQTRSVSDKSIEL